MREAPEDRSFKGDWGIRNGYETPVTTFRCLLPADPAALAPLRAAVRDWLSGLEIVEQDVAAIVAACSEIAADGIEVGPVALRGLQADSDIVVRIEGVLAWGIEDHPSRYVAALLVDDVTIARDDGSVAVVLRKAASRGLRL